MLTSAALGHPSTTEAFRRPGRSSLGAFVFAFTLCLSLSLGAAEANAATINYTYIDGGNRLKVKTTSPGGGTRTVIDEHQGVEAWGTTGGRNRLTIDGSVDLECFGILDSQGFEIGGEAIDWDRGLAAGEENLVYSAVRLKFTVDEPVDALLTGIGGDRSNQVMYFHDQNREHYDWSDGSHLGAPIGTHQVSLIPGVTYLAQAGFSSAFYLNSWTDSSTLSLTFIPEPSTALLLLSGLVVLARKRRGAEVK